MAKNNRKRKNIIKVIATSLLILGSCLLLATGVLYASSNPTIMTALNLATTVKPEPFTELYFEDHAQLPSKVTSKKEYAFTFTIHNLEDQDVTYPYEVYLDLGDDKIFLDKNTALVKKDGRKTVTESFRVKDTIARTKIVVNLINKNEQIAFWIEGVGK